MPLLTDQQRKKIAKWMTNIIFGYIFYWLLPILFGIGLFLFLSFLFLVAFEEMISHM